MSTLEPWEKIRLAQIAELQVILSCHAPSAADSDRIERALRLVRERDQRWLFAYAHLHGWELIAWLSPQPPRRLPSVPYEELPR